MRIVLAVGLLVVTSLGLAEGGDVPFFDAEDGTIEVALGYLSHIEASEYVVVVRNGEGRPYVLEASLAIGTYVPPARLGRRAIVRAKVLREENAAPRLEIETVDHALPTEFEALLALRKLGIDIDQDDEGYVKRVAFFPLSRKGDPIRHLAAFERLKNLALANVTDADLLKLVTLRNLEFVSIDGEGVTGSGLAGFANCKNLNVLNTSLPDLTDAGLEHLTVNENLSCLRLNGSKITGAGLEHVGKLAKLRILEVEDTRVGDAGLKHLAGLSELEYLFLTGTPITDDALVMIPELRKLWALKLDRTAVTDEGLSNFREFDSLKGVNFLYLQHTKITDAGLAHLVDIEHLEGIDLAGDGITDAGLAHLATHERLKWIHAPGCPITDAAATRFKTGRDQRFYITRDRPRDE